MVKSSKNKNKVHNKPNSSSDIGINTEIKIWTENKKENSFDQDKIPKKINYTKDF